MKKPKHEISIKKIEMDENTAEPVIVEIDGYEEPCHEEILPIKPQEKNSIGKQLVMTRILGITEEDKNIDRRQRIFKRIITIAFLTFVIGVLAFTFYNDFFAPNEERKPISLSQLLSTLTANWYYLLLAVFSLFMTFFLKGAKLSVICRSQTKNWHFKTCVETGILGHYYNLVTPLAVGGQPFEIYHLSKHGVHGGVASSMPIIAFFLYQFNFVLLGIISLVLLSDNALHVPDALISQFPPIFNTLAIIGLACCLFMPLLVVVFSMLPRMGARLVKIAIGTGGKLKLIKDPETTYHKTIKSVIHNSKCIKKFAMTPTAFIATFLLSFAEVCALCSIAYFCLRFFGYDNTNANGLLEWSQTVQMCVILYAAISFIPTPGNSGAADLSFYMLFASCLPAGLAFPSMALWRILSYYAYIVIGFIFVSLNKKSEHKKDFAKGISAE